MCIRSRKTLPRKWLALTAFSAQRPPARIVVRGQPCAIALFQGRITARYGPDIRGRIRCCRATPLHIASPAYSAQEAVGGAPNPIISRMKYCGDARRCGGRRRSRGAWYVDDVLRRRSACGLARARPAVATSCYRANGPQR